MVKNLILSIIALAILAGCSGKKDKTTGETVEAVPVKVQKLEDGYCQNLGLYRQLTSR